METQNQDKLKSLICSLPFESFGKNLASLEASGAAGGKILALLFCALLGSFGVPRINQMLPCGTICSPTSSTLLSGFQFP